MAFFVKHIFFCINEKSEGQACCARGCVEGSAAEWCAYTKTRLIEAGLHGPGKMRVSRSGCLGRCVEGPNIVIYPDNVWYRYENRHDIDEIIGSHLKEGRVVERLLQQSGFPVDKGL